jgi:hypothetical protein
MEFVDFGQLWKEVMREERRRSEAEVYMLGSTLGFY